MKTDGEFMLRERESSKRQRRRWTERRSSSTFFRSRVFHSVCTHCMYNFHKKLMISKYFPYGFSMLMMSCSVCTLARMVPPVFVPIARACALNLNSFTIMNPLPPLTSLLHSGTLLEAPTITLQYNKTHGRRFMVVFLGRTTI